ncbi:MAG: IS1380 family transposase, partial [Solirubrobacterales bacterium]|nr:IS1380 family transposase [Solirubrobacterales bacterium]
MTLVHGMLAGADSIDDMNLLRAGSTQLILGHQVMAPSTLGTFLRAFTFGHVRQLDRVLDVALARAWDAGVGPGEGPLVIDLDSFVGAVHGYEKQGAGYGYTRTYGYHPIIATRADTGEVLHIRNRKGQANTQRGAERFVDELLARVDRAGHRGPVVLRADSGFENHKLMRTLDRRGVEFSIGVKQSTQVRALIAAIPEQEWVTIADYPETGKAQIAETQLGDWRLIVRRTRLVGDQAQLWPDWRHHTFATNRPDAHRRHRPSRPRRCRAYDPRPLGPGDRSMTRFRFSSMRRGAAGDGSPSLGRNPNEHGKKSASKIGSITVFTAACTTRSRTRGIDNGRRSLLPGFGMNTRQAGNGRQLPPFRSAAS